MKKIGFALLSTAILIACGDSRPEEHSGEGPGTMPTDTNAVRQNQGAMTGPNSTTADTSNRTTDTTTMKQ